MSAATRSRRGSSAGGAAGRADEVIAPPRGGLRAPCPCGSGKRYKMCHGRARARDSFVARPFEGLPGETDFVAFRELVPAATLTTRTVDGDDVVFATVLPMAWPALRRSDGSIHVGLQTAGSGSDPSRDLASALDAALAADPGAPVEHVDARWAQSRLQDRIDLAADPVARVYDGVDFWVDGLDDDDEIGPPGTVAAIRSSIERANEALVPTEQVTSVRSAYWVRMGGTTFVRWVVPTPEEAFMDALARLHAARGTAGSDGSTLGEGTRFAGAFRAHGLLVPVWDLGAEATAESVEEPLAGFSERLDEALAADTPLTSEERRARAGLVSRQVTLR